MKHKYIFKFFYRQQGNHDVWSSCTFSDENGDKKYEPGIYEYLIYVMTGDLYLKKDIDENLAFIYKAENNPNEVFWEAGQEFSWKISAEKVTFYHNEFEEEDGWPDLSCSLSMFKSVLIAWNAFLQLPKSVHSTLTTEIKE